MKIAITGAQSTGKSTLLRFLKQDDDLKGFEFIDELTRQIAAKGIDINEEGSNMSQIFTVTIHAENIMKKHFISDRCTLDGLVYTRWLHDQGKVDDWMMDYALGVAREVLPRYDYIFYLPPEIPIEDDGVRSADEQFRKDITKLFEFYIDRLKLKVYELSGSVPERAKTFKRTLQPKMLFSVELTEVNSLFDLSSFDGRTDHYLTEAYRYWVEKGYVDEPHCKIYTSKVDGNAGWAFIREQKGTCHLSRFTVEKKGSGMGAKVIQGLKSKYDVITLWSNPEALDFYKRLGFNFTGMKNKVEGKIYTYGVWNIKK